MGESTVSNTGLTSKIQKQLATLLKQKSLKQGPISNFTFQILFQQECGVINTHKPEKKYLMQVIVSAIGTLPYHISQDLIEQIQPTLNKSKYKTTNSSSFVN